MEKRTPVGETYLCAHHAVSVPFASGAPVALLDQQDVPH